MQSGFWQYLIVNVHKCTAVVVAMKKGETNQSVGNVMLVEMYSKRIVAVTAEKWHFYQPF